MACLQEEFFIHLGDLFHSFNKYLLGTHDRHCAGYWAYKDEQNTFPAMKEFTFCWVRLADGWMDLGSRELNAMTEMPRASQWKHRKSVISPVRVGINFGDLWLSYLYQGAVNTISHVRLCLRAWWPSPSFYLETNWTCRQNINISLRTLWFDETRRWYPSWDWSHPRSG